jgi:hypothetical protein
MRANTLKIFADESRPLLKKKIALGMVLMLMLLSTGGCYFAVGGYGWDGASHDRGAYYHSNHGYYHGDAGYYRSRENYRGGWHGRD